MALVCLAQRGSPYARAALWLLEAESHVGAVLLGPYNERVCTRLASCCCLLAEVRVRRRARTLLLLVAVIFGDARLEELSRLVIFG